LPSASTGTLIVQPNKSNWLAGEPALACIDCALSEAVLAQPNKAKEQRLLLI